ncbi:MAG TPA: hypothetical protein VFS31_09395 [Chitinophagaceae bacterium]|nr:hypothetical protein [Chitinophagaceae bacterium]
MSLIPNKKNKKDTRKTGKPVVAGHNKPQLSSKTGSHSAVRNPRQTGGGAQRGS